MAAVSTPKATDMRMRVQELFRAFNEHDVDKIVAMHTPQAVWADPTATEPIKGREAIAEQLKVMFRAFPDLQFIMDELEIYLAGTTRVAARWHAVGTMTGPIDPPGFAPTGKQASFTGACFYAFRRGMIDQHTIIYDTMNMLQQLGVMPPPGSAPERLTVTLQRAFTEVGRFVRR